MEKCKSGDPVHISEIIAEVIEELEQVRAEDMSEAMQEKLDWFERSDDNVVVCFGVCLFFAGLFVAVNWIWG